MAYLRPVRSIPDDVIERRHDAACDRRLERNGACD
jgi:hypothetical protein